MSKDADYLGTLEFAILIQHECKATHKETAFVEEKTLDGEIVWQGDVEAFDLIGHEEARTCYAWQHIDSWGHAKFSQYWEISSSTRRIGRCKQLFS